MYSQITDTHEEWKDYLVFYEWCYASGYKEGLKITRIDTNKQYSPDNCIVSTRTQRPIKARITYSCFGRQMSLKEMAAMYGLGEEIIKYRINKRGMTVEQAVSVPLRKSGRPRKEG